MTSTLLGTADATMARTLVREYFDTKVKRGRVYLSEITGNLMRKRE